MKTCIRESLADIHPSEWNALNTDGNPFVSHEFLIALERHNAVGREFGWIPQYITAYDGAGTLVGAVPLYLKTNSYGEFVFDWAWADAYHRSQLPYYPKLVAASPYSPVTGPRLLVAHQEDSDAMYRELIDATLEHARELGVSSLHWLFTDEVQTARLEQAGFMPRLGCQFHWRNLGYRDFKDYLDQFTAAKRKKIKQERRRAREQDIEFEILSGNELSDSQWAVFHDFYSSTFDRKGGIPTLSLGFFQEIGATLAHNIVLVLVKHDRRYVAGAFNLRDEHNLYGRHWGCSEYFHGVHFEACYYQGLEYCIEKGLQHFEPGAQGEHKISRGFLPTPTWSAHWIAHPRFRNAIADFLQRETPGMQHYIEELTSHSPFKTNSR
jgi:predicted N-acyltransferase